LGCCEASPGDECYYPVVYGTDDEAKKDNAVWLDAKTNDPLSTSTQWICGDTGIFLEEHQIKTYFPYGGETVDMNKDEMKVIKDFGDPGLVLMGFKPISKLKCVYELSLN